jgi:hypothetical protein
MPPKTPVSLKRHRRGEASELPEPAPLSAVLRRRPIVGVAGALWLPLAALSLAGQVYLYVFGGSNTKIPRRLDVDSELTIWSWYQASLLLFCALLLAVSAYAAWRIRAGYVRHWLVLGLALLWVSVDESSSLHELTIAPLHNALDTGGIFYFAWVIPAIFVVSALGLLYVKFLGHLSKGVRKLFLCAAGAYVTGALGGDLVGGYWSDTHGVHNLTYALMTQVEENLETAGVLLAIAAVLSFLTGAAPEWGVRLEA